MTDEERRALAAAAATIDERLEMGFEPLGGDDEVCDERWQAWAADATRGDGDLLRKRLGAEGVDADLARALLGAVRDPGARIPDWLPWFECFLAAAITGEEVPAGAAAITGEEVPAGDARATQREVAEAPAGDSSGTVDPEPFELFFEPAVAAARAELESELGEDAALLGPGAWESLERDLLRKLSAPCGPPLYELFDAWRDHFEFSADPANTDGYHGFVSRLRVGDAEAFFLQRPVLARILGTRLRQWHEASRDIVRRFHADRAAIRDALLDGAEPGAIRALRTGLSDPHDDGRQVAVLELDGARKVVCKPRDVSIDVAWADFIGSLRQRGAAADVRAPAIVAGDGYGWTEFIVAEPCRDADDVADYFRRCGELLALFHGLRSTDVHDENLIAAGAVPVLIDVETIMHPAPPQPSAAAPAAARAQLLEFLQRCVVRTCVLPMRMSVPGGGTVAVGALSAQQQDAVTAWGWEHAETDAMRFFRKTSAQQGNHALPMLDGRPVDAHAFVDEVVEGFRAMAAELARLAPDLTAPGGPVEAVAACSTRVVPRPTSHYAILRWRMDLPRNMYDGVSWSIPTYAGWHDAGDDGAMRQCRAERAALAALDIPRFSGRAADGDIRCGERLIESWAARPAVEDARDVLLGFDEAAVEAEVAVIREQFGIAPGDDAIARVAGDASDAGDFGAVARKIGDYLLEQARRAQRDGVASMAWLIAEPVGVQLDDWQLGATGDDLYLGAPGIAVFFAALARADGDNRWKDAAYASLASLRAEIARDAPALVARAGVGGLDGVGSMARALELCGRLLDDDELLEDAFEALRATRRAHLEADTVFDVTGGSAGFLLSCLSLHRHLPRNALLQRARAAGEHLVAAQVAIDSGGAGWPVYTIDRDRRALTGVAHGSAGVALALLRLYALDGDGELLRAAQAAIAAERGVFVAGKGWPDLRKAEGGFGCAWCYGAAGVGLARLLHAGIWADEQTEDEIEFALAATRDYAYDGRDHLCCGEMSRVELLLAAGRRRGDEALVAQATARAGELLRRAREHGFRFPLGSMPRNPSLFTGLAGVGYELLRLDDPQAIPSIVAWE